MTASIRIGVCGTGSFGRNRARTFAENEGAVVGAGWSRSEFTRASFAAEYGVPVVDTWQALCAHPEVDAVCVCTPNAQHFSQAEAALKAGKHVLVETPLGVTNQQVAALAALAKAQNLVLHHGAKWRYHPDHRRHIRRLRSVGQLLFGLDYSSFDFGPERRWYMDPVLTGGARAYLPYVMLTWLEAFGAVKRATGSHSTQDSWSAATITLEFVTGGHATVGYALGLGIPEIASRHLVGTGGSVVTEPDGIQVLVQNGNRSELTQRQVDIVACESGAFVQEIRGERDHRTPLDMDLHAWELVDQALD